jgi:hypothetical protein
MIKSIGPSVLVFAAVGCFVDTGSDATRPCTSDGRCLSGYACIDGLCAAVSDASSDDGGAGPADAGPCPSGTDCADAGDREDAGGSDSGPPDAGHPPPALSIALPGDAECAATCRGAVVRASDTSYVFKGAASDPLGLVGDLSWSLSRGSSPLAHGSVAVSAEAWAYTWDVSALGDDGAAYLFEVTATNTAGVSATARRTVWVDRVAPTVLASASGKRLIARDAVLLEFSEPMDVASVVGAAALNGSAPGKSFGSADGTHFSFSSAADLQPYTVYQLSLKADANDRAGNPGAATELKFLTDIVQLPPGPTVVGQPGAQTPRLAIDRDGRPFVVYATAGLPRLAYWNGVSAWVDGELSPSALAGAIPSDLQLASATDLHGSPTAHVLFTAGAKVLYARATDLKSWTGAGGGSPDALSTAADESYRPGFGRAPGSGPLPSMLAAFFAEGGNAVYRANSFSSWSAPTVLLAGASAGGGSGVASTTAWYFDLLMPGTPSSNTGYSANGIEALGRPRTTSGVAYMVWSNYSICIPVSCNQLVLSCSPNPVIAGSWKQPSVVATSNKTVSWQLPDLAVSDTTVAVTAKYTGAPVTLLFGSAAAGDCLSGSPTLSGPSTPALGARTSATSPSVALGPPNGSTMWGAWIETVDGASVVMVNRN